MGEHRVFLPIMFGYILGMALSACIIAQGRKEATRTYVPMFNHNHNPSRVVR
jgi:hypothetical protein